MAESVSVVIEPVPSRCSPGVILAFLCDTGKLDRKQVGKITLLGSSARVEISAGNVQTIIKRLDGSPLADRPVRVRHAGPINFGGFDHFGRLAQWLDLEAAAEQEAIRLAAQADTTTRDGTALTALTLRDAEYGLGGRLLLTFSRKTSGERLPPNRLQPGAPVILANAGEHRRRPAYRGVVFDRDFTTVGVAIEPPDDDLPDDSVWRLTLAPDEVSRQRQKDALGQAAAAKADRLAELREVLLGEREPERGVPTDEPSGGELNPSQCEAVRFALAAKDVAVIHGPPGTGKTTTLVELIRRAVARGERVLACAASNHAVDHLLDKLLAAGEEPVRIGHPARVDAALRDRALDLLVEKHADARQARKFVKEANALFRRADSWSREKPLPGEKAALRREARDLLRDARSCESLAADRILEEARIVCGTLTGLTLDALGPRRFDLAVIDEAGQATEPACWMAIGRAGRLVLAGDHRQLPPTVLSPQAAAGGLAVSLMERIVAERPSVARLLNVQYRMNAAIMEFSNAEFYDGQLVADPSVSHHRLGDLDGAADDQLTLQPLLFVDTAGASYDEELEIESTSRRNPREAALAVRYVRRLLDAGVPATAIGVIAPYRAQVRLLRDTLTDWPDLEVDSVDGFQGREKEAIVISFVRSHPKGEIGFLADYRRTNVAFTRARRKLIVIGDSATLAGDPFYRRMIEFFDRHASLASVWEEHD